MTPRLQAVVEIGPNPLNDNWNIFDISPNAFEDQGVFGSEFYDVECILENLEVDERNDSGGPLAEQVRAALLDMAEYVQFCGKLPRRRMFTFALPGENVNLDVNVIPSDSMEDME